MLLNKETFHAPQHYGHLNIYTEKTFSNKTREIWKIPLGQVFLSYTANYKSERNQVLTMHKVNVAP